MSRKSQRNRKRHQMQSPLLRAARQYGFKARRARRTGATPLTDSEAVAAASELLRAAATPQRTTAAAGDAVRDTYPGRQVSGLRPQDGQPGTDGPGAGAS